MTGLKNDRHLLRVVGEDGYLSVVLTTSEMIFSALL